MPLSSFFNDRWEGASMERDPFKKIRPPAGKKDGLTPAELPKKFPPDDSTDFSVGRPASSAEDAGACPSDVSQPRTDDK